MSCTLSTQYLPLLSAKYAKGADYDKMYHNERISFHAASTIVGIPYGLNLFQYCVQHSMII